MACVGNTGLLFALLVCSMCRVLVTRFDTDEVLPDGIRTDNITWSHERGETIHKWMRFSIVSQHFTRPRSITSNKKGLFAVLTILLCGDLELNPGPVTDPCGMCGKGVRSNQKGICCDQCSIWYHCRCIGMDMDKYEEYQLDESLEFLCQVCDPGENEEPAVLDDNENYLDEIVKFRKGKPKQVIIAHLNINSMKTKYVMLSDILYQKLVDILIVGESKLDDSYSDSVFNVNGYRLFRNDRTRRGGGLMIYVRSDIPCRKLKIKQDFGLEVISFYSFVEVYSFSFVLFVLFWSFHIVYLAPLKNL